MVMMRVGVCFERCAFSRLIPTQGPYWPLYRTGTAGTYSAPSRLQAHRSNFRSCHGCRKRLYMCTDCDEGTRTCKEHRRNRPLGSRTVTRCKAIGNGRNNTEQGQGAAVGLGSLDTHSLHRLRPNLGYHYYALATYTCSCSPLEVPKASACIARGSRCVGRPGHRGSMERDKRRLC